MKTLTATNARNNWFELIKSLIRGHQMCRITSKEGDVVVLPEDEYANLIETLELLSSKDVLKGIKKAKKEIKEGKTYTMKEVFGD